MRRVHGEEVCALTRGGLIGTPYSCGNRLRKKPLNDQKSAEAIVPCGTSPLWEGLNHEKSALSPAYASFDDTEHISFPVKER
ncbi:hypothetical protein [Alteribacillus sp. HJP-4]|uniref:hypothetical protein n=1 Tax=Alteribacillus sp. HJP-4 TaxID=2775394 RepID=UPI0035CD3A09